MAEVLIQPLYFKLKSYRKFAEDRGLKFEIVDFAIPYNLDDESQFYQIYKTYQQNCPDELIASFHGVFNDMRLGSADPKIREVVKNRLEFNCKTASKLGANRIIFHTNYIPQIKHEMYREQWLQENANFFERMMKKYGLEILLENVFDRSPDLLKRLIGRINSPDFGVCLDTGHLNLHSRSQIWEWITVLRNNIKEIHYSDNRGEVDSHSAIGTGNINWQRLNLVLNRFDLSPSVVLEVGFDDLTPIKRSLAYLSSAGIYPQVN
ncbi:sugar phosphate isomerase/epimerase family protein [Halarsenatibacter silvermanii]|uniref:Sugar phosphate isomerase/epimerase n=1 Tax=Halarsenatibacter silvermanii TaxID=321763 RepID=A0A1G9SPR9_9FIRM|nr:sugar phosphate isomerase/epimerase family protein [Halarsenatibacter silvermanii]SDM37412.1 Sugar phosphate isomerase/epimerase [Halarsenatibacter silvermanii]